MSSLNAWQIVNPTRGIDDASTNERFFGLKEMSSALTAKYSANVPIIVRRGSPYTSSPTLNFVTLEPTCATVPAKSKPSTIGMR